MSVKRIVPVAVHTFENNAHVLGGKERGEFDLVEHHADFLADALVLVAFTDLIINVCIYVARFLLRGRLDFFKYAGSVILPEVVCTVLFTIFMYRIFYKINHMLVEKEKKGRQSLWIRD